MVFLVYDYRENDSTVILKRVSLYICVRIVYILLFNGYMCSVVKIIKYYTFALVL